MFELIARGIGIGFSGAVLPGPFQTYTINSSLTSGWRKSIILTLVPMLTDLPLIFLVVVLLGTIPDVLIRILQLAGGGVLLWIAWGAWKQWRSDLNSENTQDSEIAALSPRQILGRGVMMGWLSPGLYLFWTTVNGPILIRAVHDSLWHGAAFLLSFYGTFGCLIALTILAVDRLGALSLRVRRWLILLTIVFLVLFAGSLIVQGISA